jgi:hypothetical protein
MLRTLRCCGRLSPTKCLLCNFYSSVPDFAVSLPSVLTSQLTTLRRTNGSGFQSAHKGLAPSGKITRCKICFLNPNLYFRIFIQAYSVCPAHAGHTPLLQRIWAIGLMEKWFCVWMISQIRK